jgi:hypothetical protein
VYPDALEDEYLPSVKQYRLLRIIRGIWREVTGVTHKGALSFALAVGREGEAEVMLASSFLASTYG